MLPNLRLSIIAIIAACAFVLAASAGLIASRDPSRGFVEIPEVSRPLMQKAMMEEPEWQHFQLLAYSRRTDELQRLLELPVTPARAIVEVAERMELGAEPVSAPAVAEPAEDSAAARIALQHDDAGTPVAASAAPVEAPVESPVAAAAVPPEPVPAAAPMADTVRDDSAPVALPTEPPAAPPATETKLANVQPGPSQTAAVRPAPQKPSVTKPARKKAARAAPRKKKTARVARVVRRATIPAAATGFPLELQTRPAVKNQNATFFTDRRDR